jgi:hypothetical protein
MEQYLKAFGTLAALGGAIFLLRGLIFHTRMGSMDKTWFKPGGSMSPEGKKHFFRGILLLVLAHVMRDIIPGLINAGGTH